jgi:serine protease AprX
MVQMVRSHSEKLDRSLRETILNQYKPFKWTPCFMHNLFEKVIKSTKKLPVIIQFKDGCYDKGCKEVHRITAKYMANKVNHYFQRVSSCSAELTPNGLEEILSSCQHIKKVYLNREVKALLNVAVPSSNAANVWRNSTKLTGKGVTIAIIDTGIHPHKDLAGRITDFVDFINKRPDPYDDNGHGTHCAGDAASSSTTYMGPAPEAKLVGVKVLDKMGSGSLDTVMQGVEWCIQNNADSSKQKIDIISMSLGATAQNYAEENDDPMVHIVERAWEAGIVVCVAAGNEGPNYGTIASPGISDLVITVGALDDKNTSDTREDDDVASFSSRGPTKYYNVTKPDLLAPGVNIVSLRSPNSYLDKLQKSARVDNDYFVLSGTSMATPICAGVVALIKQSNPKLTPNQVKEMLKSGADLWSNDSLKYDQNIYGSGYINAERSIPSTPPN